MNQDYLEQISILTPTMNRSEYMARTLHYYTQVGFAGVILIGDSSVWPHRECNQRLVREFGDQLRLVYRYFPKPPYFSNAPVIRDLIEMAPTPYAIYAGDDDFMIPNGLVQCAQFLERNPSFSAAHGYRVNHRLDRQGAHGNIVAAALVPDWESEAASARERWALYMRTGLSTQIHLHRTSAWRRMYAHVEDMPVHYLGTELFPCSLTWIMGKVKRLDCITAVYQRENAILSWQQQSILELISTPAWSKSVERFRELLAQELAQADGIDKGKAIEWVDQELCRHLHTSLSAQYAIRFRGGKPDTGERPETWRKLIAPESPYRSYLEPVVAALVNPPHLVAGLNCRP